MSTSTQKAAASPSALNHPPDQPRVALVTGGSSGIGRETVNRLARNALAGHGPPQRAPSTTRQPRAREPRFGTAVSDLDHPLTAGSTL
jgi:NAD(P)-dependent dehydrogenase (short-subunit alcohol dehydrogenase family)